jgi:archaellum component FlaC
MELHDYCDNVSNELTAWKDKISGVVKSFDARMSGDKSEVLSQINDIQMILEELDDRINRLKTQCPTDWEPSRVELEGTLGRVRDKFQGLEGQAPAEEGTYYEVH